LKDHGAKPISDPLVSLDEVCELLATHPSFRVIRVRQPSWLLRTIKEIEGRLLGNVRTVWLYYRVAANKDTADLLRRFFDGGYYAGRYPEARRSGVPLLWHYLLFGFRRGFDPSAFFNTDYYLAAHPDVAASHVNPLLHYVMYGRSEHRISRADDPPLS
jgi:hypothetical protein